MVRFIHVSDVHLGFEQYGRTERYKDFARAFNHAIEMGIMERVDFFLVAGDLFNKKNIRASTLLQADAILSKARDAGIPVIACEGNHDSLSFGDSWSWLGYLARKDLIILLGLPFRGRTEGPEDEENQKNGNGLVAWDDGEREGTYLERTFGRDRVRIYGFGYLGAATKVRIGELSDSIMCDDALNIGILHAGVEGIIANMHGTIPEHALRPFRDKLDYLALGHIHKRFDIDNWVFNPGSLENWSLDESGPRNPHGLYLVEIVHKGGIAEGTVEGITEGTKEGIGEEDGMHSGDGESGRAGRPEWRVDALFVNGETWRRPFTVILVDLTGSNDQYEVLDKLAGAMRSKVPGGSPVHDEREARGQVRSDPGPGRRVTEAHAETVKEPDRSELYMGTLDAYIRPSGPALGLGPVKESAREQNGGSAVGPDGPDDVRTSEGGDSTDGREPVGELTDEGQKEEDYDPEPEDNDDYHDDRNGIDAGNTPKRTGEKERPVVIVRLRGQVGLKEKIETEPLRDLIETHLHPSALYLEIRDETTREGFEIEEDKDSSSREELERQVIREILSQGEFRDHAEDLHTLVFELKKATANRETGDLNAFDTNIRDAARTILEHQEQTMQEQ